MKKKFNAADCCLNCLRERAAKEKYKDEIANGKKLMWEDTRMGGRYFLKEEKVEI